MALIATDALGAQYALTVDPSDPAGLAMILTPVTATPSTPDNSYTIKVLDMIAGALRLIGVQAAGEPVNLDDANDSLTSFNEMLDGWNADGLTIFTTRADDYNLVAGKQTYTLGTGGDFNSNRPAVITGMSAILLDNPLNPIEVPLVMYTVDDWQNNIPVKAVGSTFPQVYYDSGDFPLRGINLWPYPTTSLNNLRIYSWQALTLAAGLTTTLAFPPGYAEAFRFNLALRLAPEFTAPVSPFVQSNAVQSLARLKTMNAPLLSLRSDLMSPQDGYNYRQDMFNLGY